MLLLIVLTRLTSHAPCAEGESKSSLQANPIFPPAFLQPLWGYGLYSEATQPCFTLVLLKPLIKVLLMEVNPSSSAIFTLFVIFKTSLLRNLLIEHAYANPDPTRHSIRAGSQLFTWSETRRYRGDRAPAKCSSRAPIGCPVDVITQKIIN